MMQGRDALLSENQFFCCYHCVFSLFGRFPFWKRFFFCVVTDNSINNKHEVESLTGDCLAKCLSESNKLAFRQALIKKNSYGNFPCSRKLFTEAAEAGVP